MKKKNTIKINYEILLNFLFSFFLLTVDYFSVLFIPQLVKDFMNNKLNFDKFITHSLKLDDINDGIEMLKSKKDHQIHYQLLSHFNLFSSFDSIELH